MFVKSYNLLGRSQVQIGQCGATVTDFPQVFTETAHAGATVLIIPGVRAISKEWHLC
jgi:hypothetical protein